MDLLEQPRYEDYEIVYWHGNPFAYLGNGFSTKEFDGSDLSYYLGTESDPGGMLPRKMNGEHHEPEQNGIRVHDPEGNCVNGTFDQAR